ncbi:hypothetical protein DFS34DRAFT_376788 [Phlyctochytrium arcticum]|nr:hypothetical protein DFS34DRAFT_376788 [Phlyctochytrium arcticum]
MQKAAKDTLAANGIFVSGVPAEVSRPLPIFSNAIEHENDIMETAPPPFLENLATLDGRKVADAVSKGLFSGGMREVSSLLEVPKWATEDEFSFKTLNLIGHCCKNGHKGVAATYNGTERTLDREVWSRFYDLIEEPWFLVRYGETGSSAHQNEGKLGTRLVDWTVSSLLAVNFSAFDTKTNRSRCCRVARTVG